VEFVPGKARWLYSLLGAAALFLRHPPTPAAALEADDAHLIARGSRALGIR
jgi:hypothetical protein